MKEYILCSAYHMKEEEKMHGHTCSNIDFGYVVAGFRHCDCISLIAKLTGKRMCEHSYVSGFLTSSNRFVNRVEAMKIAFCSGQIKEQKKELYSEDLY